MRRRVVVTGIGVISPLGDDPAALAAALGAGLSGLAPVELFDAGDLAGLAGEVRGFDPGRYLGDGNLRPLDRTARLAASAAGRALVASGLAGEERRDVGLCLGTMFGSVRTISEFDRRVLTAGPIYAKPMVFANTVINAAAGQTAIWHGLQGVNSTVAGGTASGVQALACAAELIRGGRAPAVLAGGADELCFETFHGFSRAGLTAGSTNGGAPCAVPFDARRNGFVPAEGAALLMLEEAAAAAERGAAAVAEITGSGLAYDPSRGRDRRQAVSAAARAVRSALADAGLEPRQIDAASASANGSVASDRTEILGIAEVCGIALPVTAVKSMLGESLGAGGAFQAVALIAAMTTGVLPGIRGLERLADEVPAAMASAASRQLEVRRGLVTAVGLDGQTSALVIERR